MNKKVLLIIVLSLTALAFVGYQFVISKTRAVASLRVVSKPSARIFLNDKLIGTTPYEDKHSVGEYVLKLIPEETASISSSWQGKIKLNPSVLTYVNRELGISELTSAGEILTLEKTSQNEAQLAVLSQPDGAGVLLDGQTVGTTPLFLKNIGEGPHDVTVTSTGFVERTVRIKTTNSYKLAVSFQMALAQTDEILLQVSPTPTTESGLSKPYIVVKDTPTGFLRVRNGPSQSFAEISRIKPSEKYPFLEEKEGWYKISLETGKEGWVSSRYAEKVE